MIQKMSPFCYAVGTGQISKTSTAPQAAKWCYPRKSSSSKNARCSYDEHTQYTEMRIRSPRGLRGPSFVPYSPYSVESRPTWSLRPFSITTARCKSSKIHTPFSGPQRDSPQENVTISSPEPRSKNTRVSYLSPIRNSCLAEEPLISLESTRPFPERDLSSTRPAPLETPEAPQPHSHDGAVPISVRLSYLYRLGKSYLSFYKTGLKNVWFNYKEYRKIKERLGSFPLNDVVKYGGKDGRPTISRREYQMYLRTRHDIRKLIPFGLILAICGEFTPLVVLVLGSAVVPSTCRIPKQVSKDQVNLLKRYDSLGYEPGLQDSAAAHRLAFTEARVGYVWGLMPSPRPLPLLHSLLRRRVRRRAEELVCDAILVRREGGLARLEPSEILQFARRAGGPYLQLAMSEQYRSPELRQVGLEQLKKRVIPTFEQYIDVMLQTLRNYEKHPQQHYFAGLTY
jgi:hypothetical protein